MKTEKDLYHVAPKDSKHKVWGIYSRRSGLHNLFRLVTITFSREAAIQQAVALANDASVPRDYSIQGASDAAYLSDKYNP